MPRFRFLAMERAHQLRLVAMPTPARVAAMEAPLILASTSRYRRELLERLHQPFTCAAPRCDEDALKDPRLSPQALAEHLALQKARSLSAAFPHAVIIGGDQVCEHQGAVLGKPGSVMAACQQLSALAGGTHQLITALVVLHGEQVHRHTDCARLHMRALSAAQIQRYVEQDQPLDCAGAYKLERGGIALFHAIDCADHSAITGMPLLALVRILASLGYELP
jgi:septum formation protein